MKYIGSKNRHASGIIPFLNNALAPNQLFVEPFCGGCNITDKITNPRMAADIDEDLISMWQAVSRGWTPPEIITEDRYYQLRQETVSPLRGYAAFALSYGGKKFGGWCRDSENKRNYVAEAYRNACAQFPKLFGVDFKCCSYEKLSIPTGSVVYCDPPYANTTSYSNNFNHDYFFDWVRTISQMNTVFISEYSAPPDFKCIWEKSVSSSLTKNTGEKRSIERLFQFCP